jgi:Zn-dependent protease
MRWTIRLGTLAGIRVEVHVTFLLLLAAIALYKSGSPRDAFHTVLHLLLVFGLVILHEFGHALMARRFGIATREIVLLPIGGVARLERMPEKPLQEILVALAGPAVNVVLATVFAAVLIAAQASPATILARAAGEGTLELLFIANAFMVVFNLIPAFPMDGGRVLRGALALFMPFPRATRIASFVGQGFALVFAAIGILVPEYVMLVLIAMFVFLTAAEERAIVQTRSSLAGMPASAAMVTAFVSLETRHEISHAVDLLLAGEQQDFPVLEGGQFLGMLSRADLLAGLRREGADAPIGRLVRTDVEPIELSMPLDAALVRMRAARLNAMPVMARGRLVGLLTIENIGELLLVQEARQRHSGVA